MLSPRTVIPDEALAEGTERGRSGPPETRNTRLGVYFFTDLYSLASLVKTKLSINVPSGIIVDARTRPSR